MAGCILETVKRYLTFALAIMKLEEITLFRAKARPHRLVRPSDSVSVNELLQKCPGCC